MGPAWQRQGWYTPTLPPHAVSVATVAWWLPQCHAPQLRCAGRPAAAFAAVRYKLVYVPSSKVWTAGGITDSQSAALATRRSELLAYVNRLGGSVITLTQVRPRRRPGPSSGLGWYYLSQGPWQWWQPVALIGPHPWGKACSAVLCGICHDGVQQTDVGIMSLHGVCASAACPTGRPGQPVQLAARDADLPVGDLQRSHQHHGAARAVAGHDRHQPDAQRKVRPCTLHAAASSCTHV